MIYCHICDNCGEVAEKALPMSQSDKRFRCPVCHKMMRRNLVAETKEFKITHDNYPMESDAAGVAPEQVDQEAATARQLGVPTRFNRETGAPIFTSRRHRANYCKAMGLYDRNAGYGDATPTHPKKDKKKQRSRLQDRIRAYQKRKRA